MPMRRDKALKAGVGYVPEDRRAEGFVRLLGVGENATMSIVDRLANRIGAIIPRRRDAAARPVAERLSIVSAGMSQPLGELSGGNQQKVTVARAVASKPKLVVAMTPTRGVDVASKAVLLATLSSLATDDGAAVMIATDDLDDLVICDRVVVLRRGEVVAELTEPPFDREELIAAIEGLVAEWERDSVTQVSSDKETTALAQATGSGSREPSSSRGATSADQSPGSSFIPVARGEPSPRGGLADRHRRHNQPCLFHVRQFMGDRPASLLPRRYHRGRGARPDDRQHGPVPRRYLWLCADGGSLVGCAGGGLWGRPQAQCVPRASSWSCC